MKPPETIPPPRDSVLWYHWLLREAAGVRPTAPWEEWSEMHRLAEKMAELATKPPPGVCPECLEPRPDDERVENGMKCAQCSYGVPQGGLTG